LEEKLWDKCYRFCHQTSSVRPLSHWKVSFESRFRKSTFERKLSGVNGPLSQNRTCSILWKSLSKVINFPKWTVHTWKFSFEGRLSKETFQCERA